MTNNWKIHQYSKNNFRNGAKKIPHLNTLTVNVVYFSDNDINASPVDLVGRYSPWGLTEGGGGLAGGTLEAC